MIQRGEIRFVDFAPAHGAEADKKRPAVVVSNNAANESAFALKRGMITVVPLTSNTDRIYPFQVLVPADSAGLERDSKAQIEQIRSLDVTRVGRALGILPNYLMNEVEAALRLHLAV